MNKLEERVSGELVGGRGGAEEGVFAIFVCWRKGGVGGYFSPNQCKPYITHMCSSVY